MYTGLDLVADILSLSYSERLKIGKIEKILDRYSSQIPNFLRELEYYDLISTDLFSSDIIMTVKGAEFLNLYNYLKELVCLDLSDNLDL